MELANKVGAAEIINRVVDDLKDENEQYRKMVMETIEKVQCLMLVLFRFFNFAVHVVAGASPCLFAVLERWLNHLSACLCMACLEMLGFFSCICPVWFILSSVGYHSFVCLDRSVVNCSFCCLSLRI